MKIVIIFLCLVAFTTTENIPLTDKVQLSEDVTTRGTTNINDAVDEAMIDFGPHFSANLEPLALPDITEGFEYNPLLITYHGELVLTNGILFNLGDVVRSGDAYSIYDRQLLRIQIGIAIRSVEFTYDYSASIMDLGPNGYLEGTVDYIVLKTDFLIDTTDSYIFMQDFKIERVGNITIRIRGNILIDWLYNIVISMMTTLFRGTLTTYISDHFRRFFQDMIDEINRNRLWSQGKIVEDAFEHKLFEVLKNTIFNKMPENADNFELLAKSILNV